MVFTRLGSLPKRRNPHALPFVFFEVSEGGIMKKAYVEKLKDQRWQRKRLKALQEKIREILTEASRA